MFRPSTGFNSTSSCLPTDGALVFLFCGKAFGNNVKKSSVYISEHVVYVANLSLASLAILQRHCVVVNCATTIETRPVRYLIQCGGEPLGDQSDHTVCLLPRRHCYHHGRVVLRDREGRGEREGRREGWKKGREEKGHLNFQGTKFSTCYILVNVWSIH